MSISKRIIDMTGQRFEKLTVIKFAGKDKHGKALWECKCDCGKTVVVLGKCLRNGNTKSCGCYSGDKLREYSKEHWRTHGESKTRLHQIWCSMIQRCTNPNSTNYEHYGGRGITVCNEWIKSYTAFRDWALKNGYKDNLSIDRINNDLGYSPSNCRWADFVIQARNTSKNVVVTYHGETHCLIEWVNMLGLNYKIMRARIVDKGWEPALAFETPCGSNPNRRDEIIEFNGERHTLREWSEICRVPYPRLRGRIYLCNWSTEKALTTPFRDHKPYKKRKA